MYHDIPVQVPPNHPKCLGYNNGHTGEFCCDYDTFITCDECKFGGGNKDPDAERNRVKY